MTKSSAWSGCEQLCREPHRTAQEIGREVLARVKEWGPGEQDDRTVVIVKAVNP